MDLESLAVDMRAEESVTFDDAQLAAFRDLVGDDAPVHWSVSRARAMGYRDRIVYGFLVASRFSGILGTRLPGPRTVIYSVRFDLVAPVYLDERIRYVVRVSQVAKSVRTAVLELSATREDGELVLRGTAQCGFPK